MKIKICDECKVKLNVKPGSHRRLCDECRKKRIMVRWVKNNNEAKELRKQMGLGKYRDKKCEICKNMMKNVIFSRRYCLECGSLLGLQRARKRQKDLASGWRNIPEEEKLRRMNIIAKEFLNEETM